MSDETHAVYRDQHPVDIKHVWVDLFFSSSSSSEWDEVSRKEKVNRASGTRGVAHKMGAMMVDGLAMTIDLEVMS